MLIYSFLGSKTFGFDFVVEFENNKYYLSLSDFIGSNSLIFKTNVFSIPALGE
jgi:hypothetical protein